MAHDENSPFKEGVNTSKGVREYERNRELVIKQEDAKIAANYDLQQEEIRKEREVRHLDRAVTDVETVEDETASASRKRGAHRRLDKLAATLPGRMLFKKALAARGLDEDTYAEMVEISAKVGRGEVMEFGKLGEPVQVFQDSKTALEARKHVTTSLATVHDVDRKQEERPPQITIIIGEPFKEASDATDTRNKGHTVGTPQWTDPSPEESE